MSEAGEAAGSAAVTLRLTRRFGATRERVFEAWTSPDVLRLWWAARPDWEGADAEVDLRPGGRYRLSMRDSQTGIVHAVAGEYTEVSPPARLAYTWTWEGEPGELRGSEHTLVVVDFIETDRSTEVVLTHTGFAGELIRDLHGQGWNGCLDNLGRRALAAPGRRRRRRMSTDVMVETVVARPRDAVARYTTDWRNEPVWMKAINESKLVTAEPFGVGARVKRVASFLGKRVEYVSEVVDYDPDARLVMRSVEAPFPMTVTYEFEDSGGGTRVRVRAQGEAGGFYRLAAPVLSLAVRRGIEKDLANLKQTLESRM